MQIKSGSIVFLTTEYFELSTEKELDKEGFRVLSETPDASGTVPCQRISDGDYCCLPLAALEPQVVMIKGRFYRTTNNLTLFIVSNPLEAAQCGFFSAGVSKVSKDTSEKVIPQFDRWLTEELEFKSL